jgi:hypothetical protein
MEGDSDNEGTNSESEWPLGTHSAVKFKSVARPIINIYIWTYFAQKEWQVFTSQRGHDPTR